MVTGVSCHVGFAARGAVGIPDRRRGGDAPSARDFSSVERVPHRGATLAEWPPRRTAPELLHDF
jgi:hypothetical protein